MSAIASIAATAPIVAPVAAPAIVSPVAAPAIVSEEKKQSAKQKSDDDKFQAVVSLLNENRKLFKTNTFGNGIEIGKGWICRATGQHIILAMYKEMYDCADRALRSANYYEKRLAAENMNRLIEASILQSINGFAKWYDNAGDLLQRLFNTIPKEVGMCSCVSGKCVAHVLQVPAGINPRMKLEKVGLHVLVQVLLMRTESFMASLNRVGPRGQITREMFLAMKSTDVTANYHNMPLKTFRLDQSFDELVKIYTWLAGNADMPSAYDVIKDAHDTAAAIVREEKMRAKVDYTLRSISKPTVKKPLLTVDALDEI